ncbi:MAG: acyl-CoA dehydrogenase family protein [Dehalococcoidia bacterium]|nr:acyl-CoA dehydrogenase family protein [Dehalococcoidia bacterium]
MDWNDSPEQAAFRADAAEFIRSRLPEYYRDSDEVEEEGLFGWYADRISEDPNARKAAADWASALAERGWVAPHWPKEYGGGGLTTMEQFVLGAEMAKAHAPMVGGSGVLLLGPTLIIHGSDDLKQRVLPKILKGETAYAQGYSEPGAGSDLGSLQTRAVRDGDEYVINGQKIWTSAAHMADALFMLVRTDPDAPKHRGISFFVLEDIKVPGISVRPLIGANWGHTVNETFFEDVRVPAANLVGEENRGWYVGMTLLDFERSGISGAIQQQEELDELIDAARSDDRSTLARNTSLRARIADRWTETAVSYNFSLRIASMQAAGLVPNYEASMGKMFGSEIGQEIYRTGVRTFGLYSNLWSGDSLAPLGGKHIHGYVRSIPATIAGGSSEVQRNIIATRGLGLPRG